MKENKTEQKKELMKGSLNKNKNNRILFNPVIEDIEEREVKIEIKKEITPKIIEEEREVKTEIKKEEDKITKKGSNPRRKNYILPQDIIDKMNIITYMDRDIKDNTDLVIKALSKYLDSNYCKNLINEYNILKGGYKNE